MNLVSRASQKETKEIRSLQCKLKLQKVLNPTASPEFSERRGCSRGESVAWLEVVEEHWPVLDRLILVEASRIVIAALAS